jgi:hypothetical protein
LHGAEAVSAQPRLRVWVEVGCRRATVRVRRRVRVRV